jgi:hypothetical protein
MQVPSQVWKLGGKGLPLQGGLLYSISRRSSTRYRLCSLMTSLATFNSSASDASGTVTLGQQFWQPDKLFMMKADTAPRSMAAIREQDLVLSSYVCFGGSWQQRVCFFGQLCQKVKLSCIVTMPLTCAAMASVLVGNASLPSGVWFFLPQ